MNILQVSHSDNPGERFNGYDLMEALKTKGISSSMLVRNKKNRNNDVHAILTKQEEVTCAQISSFGQVYQTENIISPWVRLIVNTKEWKDADIVHYQFMRAFPISVYDMNCLFSNKRVIWTVHNFWPMTGGCIHPLNCIKWKTSCSSCFQRNMKENTPYQYASYEFQQKRKCYKENQINVVVASDFMKNAVEKSSIMSKQDTHFIPFGIKEEELRYDISDNLLFRRKYGIPENKIVIGFRNHNAFIKGINYIWEALRSFDYEDIEIVSVGGDDIPDDIKMRYSCKALAWLSYEEIQSFYAACDIFIMPSIVESFGLMAIEAMSKRSVVICFKDTVLEEIINAPECGIAVQYKNSNELGKAIYKLVNNNTERRRRADAGREYVKKMYSFEEYVNRHIELYLQIMERVVI